MYHDQVIERFNSIDHNMVSFATFPLRSLVNIMAKVSHSTTDYVSDIVRTAATAPQFRGISPVPPTSLTQLGDGIEDQKQ